ncbi:MAG: hypothetical protein WC748_10460 [Legionellales bacterium]
MYNEISILEKVKNNDSTVTVLDLTKQLDKSHDTLSKLTKNSNCRHTDSYSSSSSYSSYNDRTAILIEQLVEILKNNNHVIELNLSSNKLDYYSIKVLSKLFVHNKTIKTLNLENNEIDNKTALMLLENINNSIKEQHLTTSFNYSTQKSQQINTNQNLTANNNAPTSSITTLILNKNKINDSEYGYGYGIEEIAKIMNIESLHLDSNHLSDKSAKYLAGNKKLKKLIITNNKINEEGIRYLANSEIEELHIKNNLFDITSKASSYNNTHHWSVYPSYTNQNKESGESIELLFLKNKFIKKLDVELTLDVSMLRAIKDNEKNLTVINLQDKELKNAYMEVLKDAISKNTAIIDIKYKHALPAELINKINQNLKQKVDAILKSDDCQDGLSDIVYKLILESNAKLEKYNALTEAAQKNNENNTAIIDFIYDLLVKVDVPRLYLSKRIFNPVNPQLLRKIFKNRKECKAIEFDGLTVTADVASAVIENLNIVNLGLRNCSISDDVLEALLLKLQLNELTLFPGSTGKVSAKNINIITNMKSLNSLTMQESLLTEETILSLLKSKTLQFTNINLPIPFETLHKLRKNSSKIVVLELKYKSLNDAHVLILRDALKDNSYVTEIDLTYNEITDIGAKEICQLKSITKVGLNSNKITDEGAIFISKQTHIKQLSIAGNLLTDIGMSELEKVNFNKLSLVEEGIRTVLYPKIKNDEVNTFNFKSYDINSQDLIFICRFLKQFTSVKTINLSAHNLTDESAKILSQLENKVALDLSKNSITDVGAEFLAKNEFITALDLTSNPLSIQAKIHLLRKNKNRALKIDCCIPSDIAYKIISDDPTITSVSLEQKELSNDDLFILSDLLQNNTHVTEIHIHNSVVTAEGIKSLIAHKRITSLVISNKILIDTINILPDFQSLKHLTVVITNKPTALNSDMILKVANETNIVRFRFRNTAGDYIKLNHTGDPKSGGYIEEQCGIKLLENPKLEIYDLIMPISLETIQRIRANDPTFTKLDTNGGLNDEHIAILYDAMTDNTHLTEFNLQNNNLTDKSAVLLSKLELITSLNLSGNKITNLGALALSSIHNLSVLNVSRNQIDTEGFKALLKLPQLSSLYINTYAFKINEEMELALLNTPSLSKTDLLLSIELELLEKIRLHDPKLTSINLASRSLNDNHVKILCDALKNNPYVTSINLSYNKIGVESLKSLAQCSFVKTLILNKNDYTIKMNAEYFSHLANNVHLKTLELNHNQITDNDIIPLSNNSTLSHLSLKANKITKIGAQIIALMKNIIELSLSENNIGDSGVSAFESNDTLMTLYLNGCKLSDAAINSLLLNKSLLIVEIPETDNLSKNLLSELQTHLSKNQQATNILIVGCKAENLDNVKNQLKHARPYGKYITNTLENKNTLLHLAVSLKNQELLDLLIIHDALIDAEKVNNQNLTYLEMADKIGFVIKPTIIPSKSEVHIKDANAEENKQMPMQIEIEGLKIQIAALVNAIQDLKTQLSNNAPNSLHSYNDFIKTQPSQNLSSIVGVSFSESSVIINHAKLHQDNEQTLFEIIEKYTLNCQEKNIIRNARGKIIKLTFDSIGIIDDLMQDLKNVTKRNSPTLSGT